MNRSEDCALLFKAISAAQGEFTTVEKNAKNPHFNSKFAPLDSIIEMIRPILPKHGLAVMQFTDIPESGNGVIIETVVTHDSGQWVSSRLQMPTVKQDPQGYGSSITYGRRYALGAALGIVSDEDVDGNQPEGAERQTKAQQKTQQPAKSAAQGEAGQGEGVSEGMIKTIRASLNKKDVDEGRLLRAFGVTAIEHLRKTAINDILAWINGEGQS